jgi:hypothetical protein
VALLPNSFSSLRLISSQTAFCSSESQNFFTSYPQTHEKSGIKIKAARESSVLLKRPNDLYIHAEGEDGSATTIWFDGSKLTMWRHDVNEVMSLDFKGTTDAMLDHVIDKYDAEIPLADLFYSYVNKTLGEDVMSAEYVGLRIGRRRAMPSAVFRKPGRRLADMD